MKDLTRVRIRFPEARDAPPVLEAVRESIAELERWMPWAHRGYSLTDASGWIDRTAIARAEGSAFEFVIEDDDGRILGCCGINAIRPEFRFANLGYWVRTSATRQGVATQAVKETALWAFANGPLERLEIVVDVDNEPSLGVARRAGAVREGVLRARLFMHDVARDAVMHSIVRGRDRLD